jgi:hypothetical protein
MPPLFHTPLSQTREFCYNLDQALTYKHSLCLHMEDFTSDGTEAGHKVKN